jgi:REP element-mobilizing transposase RayT
MPDFRRKNIRLPASHYIGHQWYFLTMVAEDRVNRFSCASLVAENLALLTSHAQSSRFTIPAYCFMPDHLHILTNGTHDSSDMLQFADGLKQESSYDFKQQTRQRLWQKKYYDHILRAHERWESVAYYIWMNPVRKGLCSRPEDWPYSGSFTVDWRKSLTLGLDPWVPP